MLKRLKCLLKRHDYSVTTAVKSGFIWVTNDTCKCCGKQRKKDFTRVCFGWGAENAS